MIDFTLTKARWQRYRCVAEHLAECARLAQVIPDFGACAARRKKDPGRKFGFGSLIAPGWSCHREIRLAEADMLLCPKFRTAIDTLEIGKARVAMAAGLRAGRAALQRLGEHAHTRPPRSGTPEKS